MENKITSDFFVRSIQTSDVLGDPHKKYGHNNLVVNGGLQKDCYDPEIEGIEQCKYIIET